MKYLLSLFISGLVFISSNLYGSTAFFSETLTIGTTTSSSVSSTAKDPELKYVLISVENADLRFWYDGTTPATNTGHLLLKDNFIVIEGINNVSNLKLISAGTSSVIVRLSYEK